MASTATRAIEGEMRLRDEVARLENELHDVRRELDHAVEEASMSAKTAADADAAAAAERERQRAAVAARLEEETTRADAAEADAKRWKLLADARGARGIEARVGSSKPPRRSPRRRRRRRRTRRTHVVGGVPDRHRGLAGRAARDEAAVRARRRRREGAFIFTLVPIQPRSRGERRSLRTFPGVSLRPSLAFNPRPRRLSTPLLTPFNSTPDIRRFVSVAKARGGEGARRD